MSDYASHTNVSEEKSRMEIERLLDKYGADEFCYLTRKTEIRVGFTLENLRFEMAVPLPDPSERQFWFTPKQHTKRDAEKAEQAWRQERKRRWRSLVAVLKAKLVAIDDGVATVEQEFLPYMVTGNGQTVYERLRPRIEQQKQDGAAMQLEAK